MYEIAIIHAGLARAKLLASEPRSPGSWCGCRYHHLRQKRRQRENVRLPRYVIKDGRVLVEDGHIREDVRGRTLFVTPAY